MIDKMVYIKAVLVVFGLLILSRIPVLATGNLDSVTVISTLVEFIFFVWGFVIIARKK